MSTELRKKIAALLAKTVESGASEAEAMSSLEAAQRLMDKHGITLEDLKSSQVKHDFALGVASQSEAHLIDVYLTRYIGEFTDTKGFLMELDESGPTYFYFGYSIDVEYAQFVRNVIFESAKIGWSLYKSTLPNKMWSDRLMESYFSGLSIRMVEKMRMLKEKSVKTTGVELVSCKTDLVTSAFEDLTGGNVELSPVKMGDFRHPYEAGYADGEGLNLRREFDSKRDIQLEVQRD